MTITIDVVEGPQYRVGDVQVHRRRPCCPRSEVRRQLAFKTGDVFSRTELRDSVRGITDLYSTDRPRLGRRHPAHGAAAGAP